MDYLRSFYVSVLGLLIVFSGCFGLSSDGSADNDSSIESNLPPVVTASWMGDSSPSNTLSGWNITVYHAMTDWDGNIVEAGWDIDLDGSIDYPISDSVGLTTLFIPETLTVNYSVNHAMTSVVFGALDDDGAWSSSPLITLTIPVIIYPPPSSTLTSNTYTADDAADDASAATDDTLIKMQMTGHDTLTWSSVQIILSVDDNVFTCSVAAGDDCQISQQAGDDDNSWESGEFIFLAEAGADICDAQGCAVDISVTNGGNTVAGDGSTIVN